MVSEESRRRVKMFWWKDRPNFGDSLNPHVVGAVFDVDVVWSSLAEAELVGIGSILQLVREGENDISRPLHIWGAGYISGEETPIENRLVKFHAVRGKSSSALGGLSGVALGDPGLLADRLLLAPPDRRFEIGIVPHYRHVDDGILKAHAAARIIDVRGDPLQTVRSIAECDFIFSSSLHGLVVADSLGIPNQWIAMSSALLGGDWKFVDYYSVFDIATPSPLQLSAATALKAVAREAARHYRRPGIERLKNDLAACRPFTPIGLKSEP